MNTMTDSMIEAPALIRTPGPAVLLLVTGLDVGGAERVVIDLARTLQAAGQHCVVVSITDDRGLLDVVDTSGLDIRFIGMRKTPRGFLSGVRRLARIIRQEDIHLVHAHLPHAAILAAAVRATGVPFTLIHTSHNFGGISWQQALALKATRRLRDADVLLAPDQHPSINAARTVLIPNGVRLAPTADENGSGESGGSGEASGAANDASAEHAGPLLLAIGRLGPQKNFGALIDAFSQWRAAQTQPTAQLWIAGDGPLRAALQNQIDELGLGEAVRLLGIRADIDRLLARAALLVMSSSWEGLPLVVLEAAGAGVPVIAPPVGALPWLLDDDCGYLAAPDALPAAFDEVLSDPAEARRRAQRLREKVLERFSHRSFVDGHLALYRQLTGS